MSPLAAIVIACLCGGFLALLVAAATLALHVRWIPRLVSLAVGALLGAIFLEILPHALEHGRVEAVMMTMLGGLLLFFLLEKLVLWRHDHEHSADAGEILDGHAAAQPGAHSHHHAGRSGLMIVIGNSVHNFCDGIVIAASFLADFALGTTTALAIIAHAIPQQVGDFAVLIHSGYTRRRAFGLNLLTGAAMLAGGIAGFVALSAMVQALPIVLALAAASLLYVAVADLIPSLHRDPDPRETAQQVLLMVAGIGLIALVHFAIET